MTRQAESASSASRRASVATAPALPAATPAPRHARHVTTAQSVDLGVERAVLLQRTGAGASSPWCIGRYAGRPTWMGLGKD